MTFVRTVHTRSWGSGPRTALLIHGIMSSSETWQEIGPRLASLGYRVTALDLGGHGLSHRGPYSLDGWADDVMSVVTAPPNLVIGHSLGGAVLGHVVDQLRPARAVYSDPAWRGTPGGPSARELFTPFKQSTAEQIRARDPQWSEADVQADLRGFAQWDLDTLDAVDSLHAVDRMPARATVPSLVQLGGDSFIRTDDLVTDAREKGFTVREVPGTGHNIHRDDPDAFMDSLGGWL
ncbi:alpha/beta hydrolase [Streptomyces sp. NPDC001508]|uniref:alpha/beta fold hydrolase n=1 Tax=Streptomyces sp. NPDC001508 TaxID=3154656 RepID=UPI00332A6256